jgi:hypothetical protein
MLSPDNRHLLIDAFRPPPGMNLEQAVGTSFTLDLDALLLAPVALAMHSFQADGSADPLALLESVRRYADRITLFCQAGAIRVPGRVQPIMTYLEDSVVPLHMPPGRLFHPKVWLLHFAGDEGERCRLLCMSRNLTFDHSWDTLLWLDGDPAEESDEFNGPLADFIRCLPGLASGHALSADRKNAIESLAQRVMSVEWDLPEGFDQYRFWPMGRSDWPQPELWGDRLLAISPFLSPSTIESLTSQTRSATLISRAASLDAVGSQALAGFAGETYVLDADLPEDDESEALDSTEVSERPAFGLRGVHAKTFIYEQSGRAWWYTGSANATEAGIGHTVDGPVRNVEFMVELSGPKSRVGIDKALDEPTSSPLRNMLMPHTPDSVEPPEPAATAAAQYQLDSLVREISAREIVTSATEVDDDYDITVSANLAGVPFADAEVTIRSATTGSAAAQKLCPNEMNALSLGRMTIAGITAFLLVEASVSVGGEVVRSAALIKSEVLGIDPDERKRKVFSSQFADPSDLIRYLMFLLTDLDVSQVAELLSDPTGAAGRWSVGAETFPLLEVMLNALARGSTESLDRVAAVLEDLSASDGGDARIPEGLLEAWAPIDVVRREVST